MDDFAKRYRELEACFCSQAGTDNTVYVPNLRPAGPVDFVLVGMEPSLGRWARTEAEAKYKIDLGFKNFTYHLEDFILHYCVMRYLCADGLTYYLTDLSKGAMTVCTAQENRDERYDRWFPLMLEEFHLVAKPDADIIPIGEAVRAFLTKKGMRLHTTLPHYSRQAAGHRSKMVRGHEQEFVEFAKSVAKNDIVDAATVVVTGAGMEKGLANSTIERIRQASLSESRKKLIFSYRLLLEHLRRQRENRAAP